MILPFFFRSDKQAEIRENRIEGNFLPQLLELENVLLGIGFEVLRFLRYSFFIFKHGNIYNDIKVSAFKYALSGCLYFPILGQEVEQLLRDSMLRRELVKFFFEDFLYLMIMQSFRQGAHRIIILADLFTMLYSLSHFGQLPYFLPKLIKAAVVDFAADLAFSRTLLVLLAHTLL